VVGIAHDQPGDDQEAIDLAAASWPNASRSPFLARSTRSPRMWAAAVLVPIDSTGSTL
jgi:hypothetical protein